MTAEECLHEGRLDEALTLLQDRVRKDPANAKHRVFLFQLLVVLGSWERALNQLKVVAELDATTLPMAQTYREAIRCEALRRDIFAGRRSPMVFGEPQQWVALALDALKLHAEGHAARSQDVRAQAFEAAPGTAGTIDGQAFEWIADADLRMGPMLEAIVNGRYYWVPFQNIARVDIEEPKDLRDVVWMPAHFTWSNGGEAVALIPTRYHGSEASGDPLIRLARRTEWLEQEAELFTGLGQRMLATDAGEYPLMDVREIVFASEPEGSAEVPEGPGETG